MPLLRLPGLPPRRPDIPPVDLSVVIICDSGPRHLQSALLSVLQSRFDMGRLEVIGVGEPRCEAVWTAVGADHPTAAQMQWIGMPADSPTGARLNRGLQAASGLYAFMMDGDSCVDGNCLQIHLDAIRSDPDSIAALGASLEIQERDRVPIALRTLPPSEYALLLHTPPFGLNALFDTDQLRRLGGFREDLSGLTLTAHEIWLRLARQGGRVAPVAGDLLSYTWSGSDAWSQREDLPRLLDDTAAIRKVHPVNMAAVVGPERYMRCPGVSPWYAQLYFEATDGDPGPYDPDRARSYSESDSLYLIPSHWENALHFHLLPGKRYASLRFDPLNRPVRMRLTRVEYRYKGKPLDLTPALHGNGGCDETGLWTFETDDPAIIIDFPEQGAVEIDECILHPEWVDDICPTPATPAADPAPAAGRPETTPETAPEATLPQTARPEYGFRIPFRFATWPGVDTGRLAVLCHAFHPDIMPDVRNHLEHIPGPFDLFLTTDDESKCPAIRDAFRHWVKGRIEIRIHENRGRDIAPKLLAWPDIYRSHDLMLHIHTKKTDYNNFLFRWRGYLFDTLMGSPQIVRNILQLFALDERLGMVAPIHYHALNVSDPIGCNHADVRSLAARMGVDIQRQQYLDFPAGSMFWARTAALRPLLDTGFSLADFPAEAGQKDGTFAHAVERLFFVSCEAAGLHWTKIVHRGRFPEAGYGIDVADMGQLARALQAYERDRRILPKAGTR